jgi:hypothetical protein
MIEKTPTPPATQRSFANVWGELDYLCKKLRYWMYARKKKNIACRYLNRLERVLQELPDNSIAILREEGLALLYELQGKLSEAIAHREREIKLMERLHQEASAPRYDDPTRAYMLRDRGITSLQERRRILDALRAERRDRQIAIRRRA